MSDLPEPLTPEYCDLRGFDFMPLFGHKLFTSELYTEASDGEFRAALKLWWAAWNQVPAGSLPNSDKALATLADFGRDIISWKEVKERALHGFIECRDGRLYHPMLCTEALDAYEERVRKSKRRVKDKERLQEWREMQRKSVSEKVQDDFMNDDETEMKRVSDPYQTHIRNASVHRAARRDSNRDSNSNNCYLTAFDNNESENAPLEDPKKPPSKPGKKKPALPHWLPLEAWNGFLDMRKKIRKPLTDRGLELLLKKLNDFREAGEDIGAVLDQSTEKCWTGVFPLHNQGPLKPNKNTTREQNIEAWQRGVMVEGR